MRISFVTQANDDLASYRYRIRIPSDHLSQHGHRPCISRELDKQADIAVFSKHFNPNDQKTLQDAKAKGIRTVFDICDYHFQGSLATHYIQMAQLADLVTCSTKELSKHIRKQTNREAIVIPDPYEMPLQRPRSTPGKPRLLWFGHSSNLHALNKILPKIKDYPLTIVTNPVARLELPITPWSQKIMPQAFSSADLVIIPQDNTIKTQCKSANRLIESIRQGVFVIASPLPAYKEFKDWCYLGDIVEGIHWAINHADEIPSRISAAQSYTRQHYSPQRIGDLWEQTLLGLLMKHPLYA